jgi:apolipoprotein N-acyltransferase
LIAAWGFGLLTATGFAPYNWWPLAVVGVAGLTACVAAAQRLLGAIAAGYVYGLGLLFVGVGWMQVIFVQAMIALVAVEALFYALLAGLLRAALTVKWWPPLAAGAWVITEFSFSRFPFGGFGWMRLGYAMVDSPLAWGYPLLGVAGVGFLAALAAQLLVWMLQHDPRRRLGIVALGLVSVTIVAADGLLIRAGDQTGTLSVGWVQGGAPGGGVYGLGTARSITNNQAAETSRLMDRVEAGQLSRPDFIVWPENSTDMDPYADALTGRTVQSAVARAKVPILVGAILEGPGTDERQTASLWWDPTLGETQRYVKRGIVPFGEWVPNRELLVPLIPELRYVGSQSVPGTVPGVLTPTLGDGRSIDLGVIVCYDLAFDQFVHDTVTNGAQALVVQSSNAMYQGTGQIDQQFAITRVRAMELRREILVVTTSGVSGLINPDGSVAFQTADHQAASGVVSIPERSGVTIAAAYAGMIELALVVLSLAGLTAGVLYGTMAKSRTESGAQHG